MSPKFFSIFDEPILPDPHGEGLAAAEGAVDKFLKETAPASSTPRKLTEISINAYLRAKEKAEEVIAELTKPNMTPTLLKITTEYPRRDRKLSSEAEEDEVQYISLPRDEAKYFIDWFDGEEYDWPGSFFVIKVEAVTAESVPELEEVEEFYSSKEAAIDLCLIEG